MFLVIITTRDIKNTISSKIIRKQDQSQSYTKNKHKLEIE